MLHPRLIPCLLIQNNGLVKTVKFKNPKYVGDPINAVRIFNEKLVDELVILDIDATAYHREPNYKLIANIANECRMPLSYGGGITKASQVDQIVGLGVEKVCISTAAVEDEQLIPDAASRVGSQSIVAVIDVKKSSLFGKYEVLTHNGTKRTGRDPVEFSKQLEDNGVGEIIVNSINLDGTKQGYDLELISKIREQITLPMTVLGGAGSLEDVSKLWKSHGLIAASAGSLFVFKGRYNAVLINYPDTSEKASLLTKSGWII
jgi:imidazole glycerol-phosphate synthase subunit HisF